MDKTLTCLDCGQEFTFTASEQEFYSSRDFTEPKRCSSCRAARKAARGAGDSYGGGYSSSGGYSSGEGYGSGGGASRSSGPREYFAAICSNCGQQANVPFQPSAGKPVYCSDCFESRRPAR